MMLIAQKPDHPAPEPHPVGQHGLGQELANFVNARIVHAGAENYNGRPGNGKPSSCVAIKTP
jgi:hypothetical protein